MPNYVVVVSEDVDYGNYEIREIHGPMSLEQAESFKADQSIWESGDKLSVKVFPVIPRNERANVITPES